MSTTDVRTISLPRPLPHQMPVMNDAHRFKVIAAGRRWGKTTMGLIAAIYGHGPETPGGKYRFQYPGAMDGATIWWVAPTYGIASLIWRTLKAALRGAWDDKSEQFRIVLPGGGSVAVKSAVTPDQSLRGIGLDGLIIDEAAYIREEAWTAALRPALADRKGWAIFISSPSGENWFYDLYARAQTGEFEMWKAFHAPTVDNSIIDPAEIVEAKASMSSNYFRQEFLAEFVAPGSGMFDASWFEIVTVPPIHAKRCRMWDLAASKGPQGRITTKVLMQETDPDWTAGARIALTPMGEWFIEDIRRIQATPLGVERLITQTAELDGKAVPIYIEQEPGAAGKSLVDYYIRHPALRGYSVRPYKPTGNKEVRANPVAAQAEHGNVKLIRGNWNRDFVDEAHIFPGGPHDDQVDAVAGGFDVLSHRTYATPVAPVSLTRSSSPWSLGER